MDKMSFAALEATLESYRNPKAARKEIPTLSMITKPLEDIKKEAETLKDELIRLGYAAEVVEDKSQIGGGSCPGETLDTYVVSVEDKNCSASQLEHALRMHEPAIIGRIAKDHLLLDPRTLQEGDADIIVDAFDYMR